MTKEQAALEMVLLLMGEQPEAISGQDVWDAEDRWRALQEQCGYPMEKRRPLSLLLSVNREQLQEIIRYVLGRN